jgi:redox-sensitive bicupin YhaK (pirin superfamily)
MNNAANTDTDTDTELYVSEYSERFTVSATSASVLAHALAEGHTVWLSGAGGEGHVTGRTTEGYRVAWRDGGTSTVWAWEIGRSVQVSYVELCA